QNDFYRSLAALIHEYNEIVDYIGNKSYDDVIENISPSELLITSDLALEEIDNILKTEYVEARDVIITPIKVEKGERRSNKYHLISQPKRYKKIDYLLKAKEDHVTGLKGENVALKLERERVQNLNLDPDIYVKYVAGISDNFGYDIESVELKNGKIIKTYIEVKTTKDIKDTNFYVSKNELDVSIQKKEQYKVFRIYDIMSTMPKYYIAEGQIEDNFYLDPVTFSARYKFEVKTTFNF
ncbi:MAG: DUF3883 domain-containing protein, partial [Acholeplasmataceae bacterium]|nr:DUF3883 domain-containing protein [Acholeplasmataceae bacterium]